MSESHEMDAFVTHRQLTDALGEMAGLIKGWLESLEERLRADLHSVRIDLRQDMRAQEDRLRHDMQAMEKRLRADLATKQDLKASERELISRLTLVDDQYRDLVGRVRKVEAKGFAPPKRRRRAQRSS